MSYARAFYSLAALLIVLVAGPAHAQIHVDKDADGAGNGDNWEDAYTDLQPAIDDAESSGDEIWIAEGVYKPTSGPDQSVSFTIDEDGVEIYGGFTGSETTFGARNPNVNKTVLSGDIGGDDDTTADGVTPTAGDINGANSYTVLYLDGTTTSITGSTIIDGVVVTGGQADQSGGDGGGLYCDGNGNGNECSPTINNVAFIGNQSDEFGGAVYNDGGSGGISSPGIINTTFSGNKTSQNGGAVYNRGNSGESSPTIVNTTFVNNTATENGGAIYNDGFEGTTEPEIVNATFTDNTTLNSDGGALYSNGFNGTSKPTITNTILWGNSAGNTGDEIYNFSTDLTLKYTLISSGSIDGNFASSTSENNTINADPLLSRPATSRGPDGERATADDGLAVLPGSPVLDAGDNTPFQTGVADTVATDLTGADRIQPMGGTVDIGAYEGPVEPQDFRVDANSTAGTPDGLSWSTAFADLQTAIDAAIKVDEIWVAEGTYTPDSDTDSFVITGDQDGLELYGGFSGSETSRSSRDPGANRTVLSGDVGGDDTTIASGTTPTASDIEGSNSNHVLVLDGGNQLGPNVAPNITNATVIDGVTVTAGQATSASPHDEGGGLYCDAGGSGNECSPTLRNIVFAGNTAESGGAIYNYGIFGTASPKITNATFTNNSADPFDGGAIYNRGDSGTSSPQITNTTFTGNTARNGGAIFNNGFNGTSNPQVTNTILWGNNASSSGDEIHNANGASASISNSVVQGGDAGIANGTGFSTGTDNLKKDPLFEYAPLPAGDDGIFGTDDDGLHLTPESPAIDVGDDGAIALTEDITGTSHDGTVDIGAYEGGRDQERIIFVDPTASGAGDGTSWADADTRLQDIASIASGPLSYATGNDEIRIAEGIYTPQKADTSFTLTGIRDGLEIRGGYPQGGGDYDPAAHPTVLSGDVDGDDATNEDGVTETPADIDGSNSNHVLVFDGGNQIGPNVTPNITNSTVLNGVIVTGGQAYGSNPDDDGGGLYCDGNGSGNECSPTIRNVQFVGNDAEFGGGIFNEGTNGTSSPQIVNSRFANNKAKEDAGAIYNDGNGGTSNPTIRDVTFVENTAATSNGGGIYNRGINSGTSSPEIRNAVFVNNDAETNGGAIFSDGSSGTASPSITNATFVGNTADQGGAVRNTESTPTIKNAILWGNKAGSSGDEVYNQGGTTTLSNTVIEGGLSDISENGGSSTTGSNNLDENPRFEYPPRPAGDDGVFGTNDDGLHVRPNSPAIDNGGSVGFSEDLTGTSHDGTVDIGAYEGGRDQERTIFVDAGNASGPYDGTSWATADTTLQDTANVASGPLGYASGNDEIRIAQGVYTPSREDTSFTISSVQNGLTVNGGYITGGGARSPEDYPTILSGDIDGNDRTVDGVTPDTSSINGTNANNVFRFDGGGTDNITSATVLDGVTVTAGLADGTNRVGGGLLCDGVGEGNECSPTIRNVIFQGNRAQDVNNRFTGGGAMAVGGTQGGRASPTLENVTFRSNGATFSGGAVSISGFEGTANPDFTNVTFENNVAQDGGAIYNDGLEGTASFSMQDSEFRQNEADHRGGSIYNIADSPNSEASPVIENVVFVQNRGVVDPPSGAEFGGGAIWNVATGGGTASPEISGARFAGNEAVGDAPSDITALGGAIYSRSDGVSEGTPSEASPVIENTSFENNEALGGGGALFSIAFEGGAVNSRITGSTFSNNESVVGGALTIDGFRGGAANATVNNMSVTNTTFTGNQAVDNAFDPADDVGNIVGRDNVGGAILVLAERRGEVRATIENVDITGGAGTDASAGGGIFVAADTTQEGPGQSVAASTYRNVTLRDLEADRGGAVTVWADEGEARPRFENVIISGARANTVGGAIEVRAKNAGPQGNSAAAEPTFLNTTITGNSADRGGAVYSRTDTEDRVATATLTNTILWKNSASDDGDEIYNANGGTSAIDHSIVQDGDDGIVASSRLFENGTGNLSRDPRFNGGSSLAGPDEELRTNDDRLNLRLGSPALDAGDDGAVTTSNDITGVARVQDSDEDGTATVNIGAYEEPVPGPPMFVSGPVVSAMTNVTGLVNPGGFETTVEVRLYPQGRPGRDTLLKAKTIRGRTDRPVRALARGVTPGGDYTVQVVAENQQGRVAGPPLDFQAPEALERGAGDQTVPIILAGAETSSFEESRLFVREGGDVGSSFKDTVLTEQEEDGGLEASIREDLVTAAGLDYYALLISGTDTLTVPTGGRRAARRTPLHLPVSFEELSPPDSVTFGEETYRMVSVPASGKSKAAMTEQFGTYDPVEWRALQWRDSTEAYREFPDLNEKAFAPGRAFWLVSRRGTRPSVTDGTTIDASTPKRVPLQAGWNQIGNPFGFAVPWSAVRDSSGLAADAIDGPFAYREGDYQTAPALVPWEGYFVFSATADTLVVPPVGARAVEEAKAEASPATDQSYTLTVEAAGEDGRATTRLGLRADAKAGRGAYDEAKPPSVRGGVRLATLEEIGGKAVAHARSAKPPERQGEGTGQSWPVRLSAPSEEGASVTLRLREDGTVPDGGEAYLLDLKRERRVTEGAELDLEAGETRRLKAIVGTRGYVEKASEGIDLSGLETSLRGGYPNPFEEEATIEYVVSETQEVTISVYDVLGRRVRTLVEGEAEAGVYTKRWDGKSQQGVPVGSGMYFIRMRAGETTETKKIVRVR